MKRSKALQLIKNNLKKHQAKGCYVGLDEACTKQAESLLDLIETHIGMLPPSTNLDKLPPHVDNCWEPEE